MMHIKSDTNLTKVVFLPFLLSSAFYVLYLKNPISIYLTTINKLEYLFLAGTIISLIITCKGLYQFKQDWAARHNIKYILHNKARVHHAKVAHKDTQAKILPFASQDKIFKKIAFNLLANMQPFSQNHTLIQQKIASELLRKMVGLLDFSEELQRAYDNLKKTNNDLDSISFNKPYTLQIKETDSAAHAKDIKQLQLIIDSLNQKNQHICKVLDELIYMAEQLNLLGVNAFMEAAKVGESSRSFASVAHEVLTLTQRVQQVVLNLKQVLASIWLKLAKMPDFCSSSIANNTKRIAIVDLMDKLKQLNLTQVNTNHDLISMITFFDKDVQTIYSLLLEFNYT